MGHARNKPDISPEELEVLNRKEWLRVAEASIRFGDSQTYIYNEIAAGRLKKFGDKLSAAEYEAHIRARGA